MHDCHTTRERLIDLLFDEMDAAQKTHLLAEVERCADCQRQYHSMTETLDVFARASQASLPDESYWPVYNEKLLARLSQAGGHALAPAAGLDEFHLTMLEDEGLARRLTKELRGVARESQLTWPEFKRDPGGYSKRFVAGYGLLAGRFFSQPNVALATMSGIMIVLGVVSAFVILDNFNNRHLLARERVNEELEVLGMLDIPAEQEQPDKGTAGTAKGTGGGAKPKPEKAQGGGGGGRQELKPASFGKLPPARLEPQLIAPTTRPPVNTAPNLPVPMTIVGDRVIMPDDNRPLPYGDPKSKSTEQSDGPGTGLGIGTGDRGGVGSGSGGGFGPGRDGNTGGGDMRLGGGGPGGGGGGGGVDYTRPFRQNEVTRKAVLLAKPEPGFTEEARKNNVTGVVRLQMVLASSGAVTNIRVVKPLPDGLTEKAIAAARQIRFTPAQKDGRAVSQYVTIEYNFNIY